MTDSHDRDTPADLESASARSAPPPADLLIGQTLAGRYEIVRKLGAGGMGTVYEGRHTALDKRVAIKVLNAASAVRPEAVVRFVNEARAAAAIGHRNIIDALDLGQTADGAHFLVLEYLEGEDLAALIDREGALGVGRAVRIARQVASALAAVHARGIVHRDLKPDNVFLTTDSGEPDVVKVLDFGVSKVAPSGAAALTRKGAMLGTPRHMAPEQFVDSSSVDFRADIYAAGVLLFQMLAGRVPFEADGLFELVNLVIHEPAPSLASLRPGVPPALARAVERAMAKKPEERFASMEAFAQAIAPFAHEADPEPARLATAGPRPLAPVESAETPAYGVAPPAARALDQETRRGHPTHRPAPDPYADRRCPACDEPVGPDPRCGACGATLPDLRIGETLAGRYSVDRLLGAGGMGRVYAGTHVTLQEPVAIKFLLGEWTQSADARARFRREALTVAKLRHPGIVTVHDYGEHHRELYMVMELVQGRTLRDVVPEGTALPYPRALALMELVLQVLEYAHARGVVHRDLKPDNVMLLELGESVDRIKLLDFGLALATNVPADDRLTAVAAVQGTPLYMSPEQCRGRDVGPATDVYAAGAMLFELIAGEPPLCGESVADTLARQMFVAPPAMRDVGVRPATTPSLEALVARALAKDPAARPTAAAFRAQIAEVLSGGDAVALRERAADAKSAAAMAPRTDRAVFRASVTPAPPTASGVAVAPAGHVVLWDLAPARVEALAPRLGVHGLTATRWTGAAPPPAAFEGEPVRAVLVRWGDDGARAVAALRARRETAKVPVIAVDAADVDDTMAIIRAGATDVAYANTTEEALCRQLLKLLRRAR